MPSSLKRLVIFGLAILVMMNGMVAPASGKSREEKKQTVQLFTDPETTDLLDELAVPLLTASGMPSEQVRFHVMLDNALNAFALPNNHIVFHSRLLLSVNDREELTSVMAHEIAHLAAGHHVKLQESSKYISISSLVASAVGMAAGLATKNPEISQASMIGGMAAGTSSMLAVVREKETQADQLAVHYMAKAGYDAHGLIAFMDRISKEQRLTPIPPPYLLTHPLGNQRVDEARDMVQRIRTTSKLPDGGTNQRIKRMQAKLEAATASDPHEAANKFRERLKKQPKNFELRYGLAMADRYGGNLAESEQLLTILLKESGGADPFILRERAMGRLENGQLKAALEDMETALLKKPDNPDFQYRKAFILKESGQLESSSRILRRLTQVHENYPDALYLFGTVEGELGRMGSSHLALARYNRLHQELEAAVYHYRQAVKDTPSDSVDHAQAEEELKILMEELNRSFFQFKRQRR